MSRVVTALVVASLAACGGSHSNMPTDGSDSGDSGSNAHGIVTVAAIDQSRPLTNTPVVFVDPDGTQVAEMMTDANGKASADVHANASVTLAQRTPDGGTLVTVLGVQPGDTITLGTVATRGTIGGRVNVDFSTASGATKYQVYGPCGGMPFTTSPAQLIEFPFCNSQTMELQVDALDSSGALVGSVDMPGVAYQDGETVTMPSSYTPALTMSASIANAASGCTLAFERRAPDARGYTTMANLGTASSANVTGPVTSQAEAFTAMTCADTSSERVRDIVHGDATSYQLDLASTLLPRLGTPTFETASRTLTLATSATGTTSDKPDAVYGTVSYMRSTTSGDVQMTWEVIGGSETGLVLPALPTDLADLGPQSGDTMTAPTATMIDSDRYQGFDSALRSEPMTAEGVIDSLPVTAKVRVSSSPTM